MKQWHLVEGDRPGRLIHALLTVFLTTILLHPLVHWEAGGHPAIDSEIRDACISKIHKHTVMNCVGIFLNKNTKILGSYHLNYHLNIDKLLSKNSYVL